MKKASFTLIEMLVVIAIIILLAGLLFPAFRSARTAAKEGKARVEINQIKTALKAYYNEYAIWPSAPDCVSGPKWAAILTGSETNYNPRKIVFLELPSKGTNQFGIVTPWSSQNSTNVYYFGFDTNYDNRVDVIGGIGSMASDTNGANLNTAFVIWCVSGASSPSRKIIGSWQ